PLAGWICFSIFYYGFPFPNTAYAKLNTGVPRWPLILQGFDYLTQSLGTDGATLATVLLSCVLVMAGRASRALPVVVGILWYLIFVVRIGGDFMSGRFLAAPFFCALALLARLDLDDTGPAWLAALPLVALLSWGTNKLPLFS